MNSRSWKTTLLWAMAAVVASAAGALAFAQENRTGDRIIRIGPDDRQSAEADGIVRDDRPVPPSHWIGLTGGPVTPELRAHVELPTGQGILVRDIVPDSPAAKGGLKQYDILLRGNEVELDGMPKLVELVTTTGKEGGQLSLEVLRKGERQTVTVKPEERPADLAQRIGGGEEGQGQFGQFPDLSTLPQFRQFFGQRDGVPFEFRQFGPGVVVGGQAGALADMPNGVSISVQKLNDQPTRVTVKRGGETWEVVGDDPESLKQLPEDLRPFVERMLHGPGAQTFSFGLGEQQDIAPPGQMPGFDDRALRQRMERMERQMQQLLERMQGTNRPAGSQDK